MNRSPTIRIGRDSEYATAYVQDRFSRITSMHIERVCDGIRDNHTQVRNTKAYLLAALFNAVSTLDSYYTMQANSDFGGSFGAVFFIPGHREKGKSQCKTAKPLPSGWRKPGFRPVPRITRGMATWICPGSIKTPGT